MPTKKGTAQPARTRDITQHGDAGARIQVQRTLRQIFLQDRARAVVAAGIKSGHIIPRPGSPQWLEIINQGLESGLLRKPRQHNRKANNGK